VSGPLVVGTGGAEERARRRMSNAEHRSDIPGGALQRLRGGGTVGRAPSYRPPVTRRHGASNLHSHVTRNNIDEMSLGARCGAPPLLFGMVSIRIPGRKLKLSEFAKLRRPTRQGFHGDHHHVLRTGIWPS
jgi:hypothetical protein